MRRALIPAALILLAAAGCSSSASTKPATNSSAPSSGAPVAPPSSGPVASAALGAPITQGSLSIVVSGAPTVAKNGSGALATFQVSMTNSGGSGDAVGPDFFGVRCDANRGDANPGDEMSTSTAAQDEQVPAGQKVSGTTVLAWLKWNAVTKCTGPTTIEAHFQDSTFVAWTLPQSVVDQVNTAAGA
ncbi:hypothetical protein KGQ19_47990 [Catenulispora sp. NL8]|uniref:Lipoprotein n=1 Tax=Catenulispora pinistramenti TaxID=2705254 RepID=A0ABS5L8D2_9ACTN|nr:hypothetical protein [Catenulispora pinistramenti]MBS2554622.1 hypothetical protein [Catenulispora pinistramenti]